MSDQLLSLAVKPIVKYPHVAQVGKTYLMTIDLQPEEGFEWQYEEEEYPVYCRVDSNSFSSKPIGEPVVVLHRFGGNYGEARFLLTAALEAGQGDISVILINAWGVPFKVVELKQIQLLPTEVIHSETEFFTGREVRETVSAIPRIVEVTPKSPTGHTDFVRTIATSPDGKLAVSASDDSTLKIWDVQSGEELRTLTGHTSGVWAVAIAPDLQQVVSGSQDRTLKVWDLRSGKALKTLRGHTDAVTAVAITPDGRQIVSASYDGSLGIWDLQSGKRLKTLQGHKNLVNVVAITPDGRLAVSASLDSTLILWELPSGKALKTWKGHPDPVDAISITPNGRLVVSGGINDRNLRLWDVQARKALGVIPGDFNSINSIAITPDGHLAVCAADDTREHFIDVFDLNARKTLKRLRGHSASIAEVAVSPNRQLAVSASADHTLKVWDLNRGDAVAGFTADGGLVCCAFAPDGVTIVAGEESGQVRFLRLEGMGKSEESPYWMNSEELVYLLDRLVEGKQTEADMVTLRQVLSDLLSDVASERQQVVIQLGTYNINIGEGKELRIGERTFREVNDETMKALTRALPLLNQFKSLIEDKTKWFVGRRYVFDAIQSFINNNPKGYFTIIGDPGQGKSAILAKYVQNTGCVAHFNVQLQGINRADQFLENVCRQLVIRYDLSYDPLPPKATQDGEFLSQLLEEVAHKAQGQPVVIAVDALDEVDVASYREANILYLPPQLPDGIYFILTRRRVEVPLTVYVPTQLLILLDEQYQAYSEQDVRTYIQNRIDDSDTLRQRIDERQESVLDFINKLTEKSEMNFMYLRYILQDIESGLYKDLDLERFPYGLEGYYEFHWRRMGMMEQPLPTEKIKIIYILAEVRQPISARKIADFSGEDLFRVEEVIEEWKPFLHELNYDLSLRLLNSANEIPTKGKRLVCVAKIENFYHVCIFDENGNKVVDKGKNEFLPNEALIQELELALNSQSVDPQTKNELIKKITSSVGYNQDKQIRYSIYDSSFRDFLHRKDVLVSHPITLQEVHRRIAEDQLAFWEKFKAARRNKSSEANLGDS